MIGKLRHIAIQTEDPVKMSAFFKNVFGMEEMYRIGLAEGAEGALYMTDGTMNLALIHITRPEFPNYRPMGLNHIGFIVEDLDKAVKLAEENGAETALTGYEIVGGEFWEHKMIGPDGVQLDLYDVKGRGWPGVSALEDLGVEGTITVESHGSGKALSSSEQS